MDNGGKSRFNSATLQLCHVLNRVNVIQDCMYVQVKYSACYPRFSRNFREAHRIRSCNIQTLQRTVRSHQVTTSKQL